MKTSVALIGFMGVGKSAVGQALAERLEKRFVELDALIERKAGKSISQIFEDEGEIAFREMEIEVIKEIALEKNQVIACGGGVVLNKINVDRLRQDTVIVWLSASPSEIMKRVAAEEGGRPLLKGKNKLPEIRELISFRKPYYERAADIKVDTSNLGIKSVVDQTLTKLERFGGEKG